MRKPLLPAFICLGLLTMSGCQTATGEQQEPAPTSPSAESTQPESSQSATSSQQAYTNPTDKTAPPGASRDPEIIKGAEFTLLVSPYWSNGAMDALVEGTITNSDGCIKLQQPDNSMLAVVFPYGTTVDGSDIVAPDGATFNVGDKISTGGSYFDEHSGLSFSPETPDACKGSPAAYMNSYIADNDGNIYTAIKKVS